MFGNPTISNTPVDDLYASQADVYGNSFANPMNPANMNSGWGIDPSLLTPSYTAPYRPGYNGSNGAYDYTRTGFFSALNNLSPWTQTPAWGNPTMHQQDNIDSVANRPVDAGMWAAQRIGMPVAAFAMSRRLMGGANMFGMSKGAMRFGSAFGKGLGSGIARGIGLNSAGRIGGMAAAGLSRGLGAALGIGAGIAAPLMFMQGAAEIGERGIFNPYINTRRSAEDLRNSYYGITFGDMSGSPITGGGMGGYESAGLAGQITRDGIRDMNLSTGEYGAAASMVSRSGLTDNVGGRQISKRVKDSIEQMKLIMSIANMPEMKDAIEQLSKLQRMGANVSGGTFSDAAGTMRQLGGLASAAGTNVQRLMNTVGAQGQYLYQANGMTPYLGQMAAANSYAGFSVANRLGLISSSQLARMGGLDGATQASLTGQINASQTLYNKISNFNRYMAGGSTGTMIGNVTKFGQMMASDPMGAYGSMMLYGRQMAGRQMSERGSLAIEDQLWEIMKNQPGMVDPKTGKISIERAVPYLMQMGMSEDQIQAFATQRVGETDPSAYALTVKGLNRNLIEQQQQLVERNDWYGGNIGRTVYSAKHLGRSITEGIANMTGIPAAKLAGKMSDAVGSAWNNLWFDESIKNNSMTMEEALGGKSNPLRTFNLDASMSAPGNYSLADSNRFNGNRSNIKDLAEELNDLSKGGNSDAIAYFKAKDAEGRQGAIDRLTKGNMWTPGTRDFLSNTSNYKNIEKDLSNVSRSPSNDKGFLSQVSDELWGATLGAFIKDDQPKTKDFRNTLQGVGGLKGKDAFSNLQAAGLAYTVATKIVNGETLDNYNIRERLKTDKDLQRLAEMTGIKDPYELLEYIRKTAGNVADNKLVGLSIGATKVSEGKGGSDAALRKASEAIGGGVFDSSAIETKHLDYGDKMRATADVQENTRMKMDLLDKLKSGHLDFAGYQATVNALDNKESVDKFSKAVDRFVGSVDGNNNINSSTGIFGKGFDPTDASRLRWFNDNKQKNMGNQPGNKN
jgi:hypothetical protein